MSKLKSYSEFINEGLIDAIKNPIKFTKIKNNAKKFQKAKVAKALNNVDYAKKLAKGKSDLSEPQKEVLKQANAAKNDALKDTTSQIGSRMDDLATTPGLKQVVKVAKTKSSLAANGIVLKAATGEEAKQLKIKQKVLTKKAAEAQQGLKDYESTDTEKKETKSKTKVDDAPVETPDTTKETPTAEETPDTKDDQAEAKIAQLEDKIKSQDKIQADASKTIEKFKAELKLAQDNKNTGRSSQTEVDAISTKIQQATEDRTNAAKEETSLKKKLKPIADKQYGESFEYVAESVSDKFARLRSNL